jgi:hypothetical protein
MAPDRLNPDWIGEWLRNPAAFLPGTRMPAYWPEFPQSPFPQLGGDAAAQIRAVRDYLMTFRGGPTPRKEGGSVVAPRRTEAAGFRRFRHVARAPI